MQSHPSVDVFLAHKEIERGLTPLSIRAYRSCFEVIEKYPQFLNLDDPRTFTTENFRAFLYSAFKDRSWSPLTMDRYRRNMKCFCKWLLIEGMIQANPFDRIEKRKLEKTLPKSYSEIEIRQILASLEYVWPLPSFEHIRDRAIVRTYAFTGLRMAELQNLKLNDLRLQECTIMVRRGKGSKDRAVPVPESLARDLGSFLLLRSRTFPGSEWLFPNSQGNRLQHTTLNRAFRRLSKYVGFRVGIHRLRHTFATELCRRQVNLYYVSKILGHSSPTTTQIYLQFDLGAAKDAIDRVPLYA